jgi:hypothetical protein
MTDISPFNKEIFRGMACEEGFLSIRLLIAKIFSLDKSPISRPV